MNIQNPRNETLQQMLPHVQQRFPQATIRKVFLTPEAIFIPNGSFKFVVRKKKNDLKIDHTLPVLWALGSIVVSFLLVSAVMSVMYGQLVFGVGGALWIILGVIVMKYIFQAVKKKEFEAFKEQFEGAVSGFDFER